eukprot:CAMPEP_0119376484 /NCGR_PEP_ID=MMETSP1334-20130426/40102_1 /TAXON_ID=127549 /ORGANISM="Calcidiscus leptoporus, Strain RCC1130" /LENGTH=471 /DNA_ID=CAMNT_0007395051 /DNA_START=85 /DNA_END=1500 /DNA_ORIENTATION=-
MGCATSKDSDKEEPTRGLVPANGSEMPNINGSASQLVRSRSSVYEARELGASGPERKLRRSNGLPMDDDMIGTHTRHGIMPGPRGYSAAKINQDRGVVLWPYNGSYNEALLAVFDGHGAKGERVAEFCVSKLPARLEHDQQLLRTDPATVLSSVVIEADSEILNGELSSLSHSCGTTAIIVYLKGSSLWTACAGDSRAVKGTRVNGRIESHELSEDCKPDTPAEMERIRQCGGVVSRAQLGRPSRVWANGRIGLAMSRSLGDGECKRCGVIPDPEIKRFELRIAEHAADDGDKFIIVASDGVWEFLSSQEACEIVAAHERASEACADLVQNAARRWKEHEGNYRDDITAVVVLLPFLRPAWDVQLSQRTSQGDGAAVDHEHIEVIQDSALFINQGEVGISRMDTGDLSPVPTAGKLEPAADDECTGFVARRLSTMGSVGDGSPFSPSQGFADAASDFRSRRLSTSALSLDE